LEVNGIPTSVHFKDLEQSQLVFTVDAHAQNQVTVEIEF
jgi:hypothetical protein